MIKKSLNGCDYKIVEASNGAEAINILNTIPTDIVLSDIHMPYVDGISLVENIRSNALLKTIPVLILTTENDQEFKYRARAAGATAWLQKPFDDNIVRLAVIRLLG